MASPVGWWASAKPLHLADGYRFGSSSGRWREITVPIGHRTRHMYVIGSTGSGKTYFLRRLLYQDIIECNRGTTLCDPHGDLAKEILGYIAEWAIPGEPTPEKVANLGDKLVLIEPHDQRFGVPTIDLLTPAAGHNPFEPIDSLLEVLQELWPESYGPRLEDVTRFSLSLLQELNLSLLEIVPLLSDPALRAALVARSRNRDVRMYFAHLAGLKETEARIWLESSRNKWSAWLSSPYVRPLYSSTRATINFADVLDQGKVLIIRISRDRLKESRRLLGALLINQLHQAALTRENRPPEQRFFHAFFCDEFEDVWTPTFTHMLIGARKFGIGLCLAHQNLTQHPFSDEPSLIDGIVSNCHTRVVFNVSHKDGSVLAPEVFFPTGSEIKQQQSMLGIPIEGPRHWSLAEEKEHYIAQLMDQQPGEAYVNLKGLAGELASYCAKVPTAPDVALNMEKIDILREHCARRFYRPLADIEREVEERWQRLRAEAAPAPRRQGDFFR